jgi:PA14 domain
VPPGSTHDFRLDATAPAIGNAILGVRMVQDGVAWFGESRSWTIANACVRPVAADRWKGEYWANATLAGAPLLTRDDGASSLAFDWGASTPSAACGIPADGFSARWTRNVTLAAGTYRFTVWSDDGVRVWFDGALRLDKWRLQARTTHTFDATLSAGTHALRMEFFENQGGATAVLSWQVIANPSARISASALR